MKNLIPAALLHDTFWAIEVGAGNLLLQQLRITDADRHVAEFQASMPEPEAAARRADDGPQKPYEMSDGIAIIPIDGLMTKATTSFSRGTSTVGTKRLVRQAAADSDVQGILLVIDSPGGTVAGTSDLGDAVADASRKKLTVAYAEDQCCSAAYWVASQASGGLFANPTSMIGSIGTVMVAYDASRMYENAGVEALVFSTGALKGAGATGAPITDEHKAAFQQIVDDLNDHFMGAVSRGRNMSRERVQELATGGVHIGQKAVDLGLTDGISTMDDVLKSMKQQAPQRMRTAAEHNNDFASIGVLPVGASLEQTLDSVHAAVEGVGTRLDKVISLRESQGRKLGFERVQQIRTLHASFGALLERCEAQSAPMEAKAAEPLVDASEASQEPVNSEARQALERALKSSEAVLAAHR